MDPKALLEQRKQEVMRILKGAPLSAPESSAASSAPISEQPAPNVVRSSIVGELQRKHAADETKEKH